MKAAEDEITKARKLYREDVSNSDDSASCDQIDDSSQIPVSPGSQPTSLAKINPADNQPGVLRSLPIDEEQQPGEMPLGFGDIKHDANLPSTPSTTQTSSKKKAPKKRKLEQIDDDDHQAKQTITKYDRTKRAKKAKLQVSEADHRDPATKTTQISTSSRKKSDLTAENEEAKPDKKRRRRKKAAKAQRPEEVINQTEDIVSTRTEDSLRTADRQDQLSLNPLRPRETVEPAMEVDSVNGECKAKPAESNLLPDNEDAQAFTVSRAEQNSPSPRFFHSPMIQSVGQILMRRCLKMTRFTILNGNEESILEL